MTLFGCKNGIVAFPVIVYKAVILEGVLDFEEFVEVVSVTDAIVVEEGVRVG